MVAFLSARPGVRLPRPVRGACRSLQTVIRFYLSTPNCCPKLRQGALCESLVEIRETDAMFGDYIRKYGAAKTKKTPCAPILTFNGGRNEVKSRLRSAVSIWLDRRQQLDVIRDRLEERGIALGQNTTLPESFAKSRRVQISVRISS